MLLTSKSFDTLLNAMQQHKQTSLTRACVDAPCFGSVTKHNSWSVHAPNTRQNSSVTICMLWFYFNEEWRLIYVPGDKVAPGSE